ncbi:pyridoxal 5'-phosphate synthase [Leifsonia sp. 1010]|uniref:pyridoxal 5'-phosphate synthase n=1 Tax=Leifsonia sp. 1010 TaxID=2817769 RepID=UPI00286398B6|nr:pyridoxal 5'-phosphate synthase [Leifsonia sp. 1010]MDR6611062.1 pyridoxamine 5'-phosphate oxidase [Leifsonia sp. 1010]
MAHTLTGDADLYLPEFDDPPAEPGGLLEEWVRRAKERGVREALAATLATTDEDGAPDARTVALRRLTADGVEFGTSSDSRKGRQLAADPRAAVVLYWRELLQQVRVTGHVERLGDAESDDLFARRTREAQAATTVSEQDAPLDDLDLLRAATRDLLAAEGPIGRPEHWYAYRVVPDLIEFWHGSPDRLHRRLRYERGDGGGGWTVARVQP